MRARTIFALLLTPLVAARAVDADRYDGPRRVEYVRAALTALATLGAARDALESELALAARQRCGGGNRPPKLDCLLELAARTCRAPGHGAVADCEAAADVILINLRSATELVDEATRVRLVRSSADYHAALLAELQVRYAALAAELVIEEPEVSAAEDAAARGAHLPASPRVIDRFCAQRDRRASPPRCNEPAATCVPSLSWQRCVAALAWYVTSPMEDSAEGAAAGLAPRSGPAPTAATKGAAR